MLYTFTKISYNTIRICYNAVTLEAYFLQELISFVHCLIALM